MKSGNSKDWRVEVDHSDFTIIWKNPGISSNDLPGLGTLTVVNELPEAIGGLLLVSKTSEVYDDLSVQYSQGLITETWSFLLLGDLSKSPLLNGSNTLVIELPEIENSIQVTLLSTSRTRNYFPTFISKVLLSPEVPLSTYELLEILSQAKYPAIENYYALTRLEFEYNGRDVCVDSKFTKKLASFLKREHSSFTAKRAKDLELLKEHGIENAVGDLDLGVPIPYLIGKHSFCGYEFKIGKEVMIPKIGTETVVNAALERINGNVHVLDMGTGSGCILLSIMKLARTKLGSSNGSTGVGIDLSGLALSIAKKNAEMHNLTEVVDFINCSFKDVAKAISSASLRKTAKFDLVVTNPPYLTSSLWDSNRLYASQKHEPKLSVVGGENGTEAYEEILYGLEEASAYLNSGAFLFVEVNNSQLATVVKSMYEDSRFQWKFVETVKDLNGIERCVVFVSK